MKKIKIIFSIFTIASIFSCCDVIDFPVVEKGFYRDDLYGPPPTFGVADSSIQRVLLEDFTGHDCGNCPSGHLVAAGILSANPERVAVVAIHAGTLSEPHPPEFPGDWRTPEGIFYLLTQVGVDEMPKGRINRVPSAATVFSYSQWVAKVNESLLVTSPLNLQMQASYHATEQQINVHVNSQWFQNVTGNYRLVILITESHIVAPQLWYGHTPQFVEDYEHEEMLRGSVSGATGLTVADNPATGDIRTDSYTFDWNPNWLPENCEIVAFVTEGENGRVVNVVKQKLVP